MRLLLEHPLAWVVSHGGGSWRATPLPLRPEGGDGERPIEALIGHFARSNPQLELVRQDPEALVLFLGVNGAISPSWFGDRTQAPTWNYTSVQYRVELQLFDEPAPRDAALADLVGAVEAGRENAWSSADMGARYQPLARRIVAFRARILERHVKFKLGQDERDDIYADILAALDREGAGELSSWMRAANPQRPRR